MPKHEALLSTEQHCELGDHSDSVARARNGEQIGPRAVGWERNANSYQVERFPCVLLHLVSRANEQSDICWRLRQRRTASWDPYRESDHVQYRCGCEYANGLEAPFLFHWHPTGDKSGA